MILLRGEEADNFLRAVNPARYRFITSRGTVYTILGTSEGRDLPSEVALEEAKDITDKERESAVAYELPEDA
jgi:hypothetical protein